MALLALFLPLLQWAKCLLYSPWSPAKAPLPGWTPSSFFPARSLPQTSNAPQRLPSLLLPTRWLCISMNTFAAIAAVLWPHISPWQGGSRARASSLLRIHAQHFSSCWCMPRNFQPYEHFSLQSTPCSEHGLQAKHFQSSHFSAADASIWPFLLFSHPHYCIDHSIFPSKEIIA